MSEIAKCRCGIRDTGVDSDYDGWAIVCNDCGCRGPFVEEQRFSSIDPDPARAWLEERVRAAGFDVEESRR